MIDEAHRYRGVFGSHIALLVRRLIRLSRHYGADPQFILSTATLANPTEFATRLTGKPFEMVSEDGSPHGRKHFVLYNPYYDGVGERSTHQETKDLLVSCVKGNLQTLCFTCSRKMTELLPSGHGKMHGAHLPGLPSPSPRTVRLPPGRTAGD